MNLKPLPQAVLTAQKLREEAKRLVLIAEELEASVPKSELDDGRGRGVFLFGAVKPRRIRKC